MEVVIAATVSDFTDSVLTAMRHKVADEAGVAHGAVSATVTAASVRVAFTVDFQTEAEADAALPALGVALSNPAAASTFLSTPELTVTVESVSTPPAKRALAVPPRTPPPSPPSASSSSSCSSVIDPIITQILALTLALT